MSRSRRSTPRRLRSVAALLLFWILNTPALRFDSTAAEEVWFSPTGGLWSEHTFWLDGSAPPVGGDSELGLTFLAGWMPSGLVTNDLGNPFLLGNLAINSNAITSFFLTGSPLRFAGDSPTVQLVGDGNAEITTPIVLAPASGNFALTGTGLGNLVMSGAITEAGGPKVLDIDAADTTVQSHIISLRAANTYSGGTRLLGGNLAIRNPAALGTGSLSVMGGTLRFESTVAMNNSIVLSSDLTILGIGSADLHGVISSAVPGTGLNIRMNNSTVRLTAPATYTGATVLEAPNRSGVGSLPLLVLSDQGSLLNTSAISIRNGSELELNFPQSGDQDRLPDSVPIELRSGALRLSAASATGAERVGALKGAGFSILSTSGDVTLKSESLVRVDRGTFGFNGESQIEFATPPTGLIGSGSGTGRAVFPYATRFEAGGIGILTYDANRVRLLNSNEYISSLASGAPGHNVLLTTANNDAAVSINSLVASGDITGTGTLTINSGLLGSSDTGRKIISNALHFPVEGNVFVSGTLVLTGQIHGQAGLTVTAGAVANRLELGASNPFTGPLTINGGDVRFPAASSLGADFSSITIFGPTGGLTYTGSEPLTFSRGIVTGGGFARLGSVGAQVLFSEAVTGPGGVIVTGGDVVFTGANSYAGATNLTSGRLTILSDSNLGIGGAVEFSGGTLALAEQWVTNRDIYLESPAVIETNGFDANLSGTLFGSGANTSLRKIGSGTITVTGRAALGSVAMDAGAWRIAETGTMTTAFSVGPTAILALDNRLIARTDRLSGNAPLTLAGELLLIGNASTAVQQRLGTITLRDGIISLDAPGEQIVQLGFDAPARFAMGQIRGTGLGNLSRTILQGTPSTFNTIISAFLADDTSTSESATFARWDPGTNAGGVIGIRPLHPNELVSGNRIGNPENGGVTPVNANYVAAGAAVVDGLNNEINSLTVDPESSLSLASQQSLFIRSGGILIRPGGVEARVTGGTIDFGTATGQVHALRNLIIDSNLRGSGGVQKGGSGEVTLGGLLHFVGPLVVQRGAIRLNGNAALSGQSVTLQQGAALHLGAVSSSIGALRGDGTLEIGTGGLVITSEGGRTNFSGEIRGSGLLTLAAQNNPGATWELRGLNTFTGGLTMDGGRLYVLSQTALGTGPMIINRGELRYPSSFSIERDVTVNGELAIEFQPNADGVPERTVLFESDGKLHGPGGLHVKGAATGVRLELPADYRGATIVEASRPVTPLSTPRIARLSLSGAQGAITSSARLQIVSSGVLEFNESTPFAGSSEGRLGDAIPIELKSGSLRVVSGSTPYDERIGPMEFAGFSTIALLRGGPTIVRSSSATRIERGTLVLQGLGTGDQLLLGSEVPLIGGGGQGPDRSIVPFAIATRELGEDAQLVTWSSSAGFTSLGPADYSALNSAAPTHNARASFNQQNPVPRTINSLRVASGNGPGLTGAGLTITSGTILAILPDTGARTIATPLHFGDQEANIFTVPEDFSVTSSPFELPSRLVMSGVVSGTAGLTKSGDFDLQLTGSNTFTGPLTINSGSINFDRIANLGNDMSEIVINALQAGTGLRGTSFGLGLTLNRLIAVQSGLAELSGLTIASTIRGAGGIYLNANPPFRSLRLLGNNTFTGPVHVGGTLFINGEAALGSGGKIVFVSGSLPTISLENNWTTMRMLEFENSGVVSTAGFAANLSGPLVVSRDPARGPVEFGAVTLAIRGGGTLSLTGPIDSELSLRVSGATSALRLAGIASAANVDAISGATLLLDNTLTAHHDRLSNSNPLTLTDGRFELLGHPAEAIQEIMGALELGGSANFVTLQAGGTTPVVLAAEKLSPLPNANAVFRNSSWDAVAGNPLARVTFHQIPPLVGRVIPRAAADDRLDGAGLAFTTYDSSSDHLGQIGIRPLSDSELFAAATIHNTTQGGNMAPDANFLAQGSIAVIGSQAQVNTITFAETTIALDDGEVLTIAAGDFLVRRDTDNRITGGVVALPLRGASFFGDGNLSISSALSLSGGTIVKLGKGTLLLEGDMIAAAAHPSSRLFVDNGTVILNDTTGAIGDVFVRRETAFGGSGHISGAMEVSGAIRPGFIEPGTLHVGAVTFIAGSSLELDLRSSVSFDQLDVTGTVTSSGFTELRLSSSEEVLEGMSFIIIQNDGSEAISSGPVAPFMANGFRLDEGTSFTAQNQAFRISYAGGDGNDVVLYAVPEPGTTSLLLIAGALISRRVRRSPVPAAAA